MQRKQAASASPPPTPSASPAAAPTAGLSAEQAAFIERKRAASASPAPVPAEQGGNDAAPVRRPSFRPSSRSPSPVAMRQAQSPPPTRSPSPPPAAQQAWEQLQHAQHTQHAAGQQAAAPAGQRRTWQDPDFITQTLSAFPEKSVASVEEARVRGRPALQAGRAWEGNGLGWNWTCRIGTDRTFQPRTCSA